MSDDNDRSELEIKILDHSTDSGAIPISWCIDKKKMQWISRNHNLKNIKVYIISAPLTPNKRGNKNFEWRGVASLTDMIAFVTFYKPGPNRIFVSVLDRSREDKTWTDSFLSKNRECLAYGDQECNGELIPIKYNHYDDCSLVKVATFDVDVPEECFAKLPPKWLQSWCDLLFPISKVKDQCAFRRRMIFAFTVQPIIVALLSTFIIFALLLGWICQLIGALACLSVSCKNINWKPLFKPFNIFSSTFNQESVFKNINGYHFAIFDKFGNFAPYNIFLCSIFPTLILTGIFYLFAIDLIVRIPILFIMLLMVLTTFILCSLGCIGIGILNYFDGLIVKPIKPKTAKTKEYEYKESELLSCGKLNIQSVRDLPRRKRTLKLKFKDTKAKVCRPFPMS